MLQSISCSGKNMGSITIWETDNLRGVDMWDTIIGDFMEVRFGVDKGSLLVATKFTSLKKVPI